MTRESEKAASFCFPLFFAPTTQRHRRPLVFPSFSLARLPHLASARRALPMFSLARECDARELGAALSVETRLRATGRRERESRKREKERSCILLSLALSHSPPLFSHGASFFSSGVSPTTQARRVLGCDVETRRKKTRSGCGIGVGKKRTWVHFFFWHLTEIFSIEKKMKKKQAFRA